MDEACDAAKSIAHNNVNAAVLVLLPLVHAGTDKIQIVKKRRDVEDKLLGYLAEI